MWKNRFELWQNFFANFLSRVPSNFPGVVELHDGGGGGGVGGGGGEEQDDLPWSIKTMVTEDVERFSE